MSVLTTPTTTRRSPLRGLAFGLLLALILFPPARHLLFSSIQWIVGIAIGTVIAVLMHAILTTRRY